MEYLFWFGFALISLAAADYLLRRYRDSRRLRKEEKEVDAMLNPPEAIIAQELGKARRSMAKADYDILEKAVFAQISANNEAVKKKH